MGATITLTYNLRGQDDDNDDEPDADSLTQLLLAILMQLLAEDMMVSAFEIDTTCS